MQLIPEGLNRALNKKKLYLNANTNLLTVCLYFYIFTLVYKILRGFKNSRVMNKIIRYTMLKLLNRMTGPRNELLFFRQGMKMESFCRCGKYFFTTVFLVLLGTLTAVSGLNKMTRHYSTGFLMLKCKQIVAYTFVVLV